MPPSLSRLIHPTVSKPIMRIKLRMLFMRKPYWSRFPRRLRLPDALALRRTHRATPKIFDGAPLFSVWAFLPEDAVFRASMSRAQGGARLQSARLRVHAIH